MTTPTDGTLEKEENGNAIHITLNVNERLFILPAFGAFTGLSLGMFDFTCRKTCLSDFKVFCVALEMQNFSFLRKTCTNNLEQSVAGIFTTRRRIIE